MNKIINFEPARCGIRQAGAYDLNTIKDFAHAFDTFYTKGFHKIYIDEFTDNVKLCNWIIKRFPIRKQNYPHLQNYHFLLKNNNQFRNKRFNYSNGNQLAMLLNKNLLKLRNNFDNIILRNQQCQNNQNIRTLRNLYNLLIVSDEIQQKYSHFLQSSNLDLSNLLAYEEGDLFAYEEGLGILNPAA